MDKSKEIDMEAVGLEWEKMINNQPVDENVVSSIILKSWHRSALAGVNPYTVDENLYIKAEDLVQYYDSTKKVIDDEFRSILHKIADEFDLSFLLYDNKCKIVSVLAVSKNYKTIGYSGSEDIVGTNSICLALQYDTPMQVFGKEHYCKIHHNYNCSAAPIHDLDNNIIGAINIGGIISHKHTLETLGLAQSIAKIIEDKIQINQMVAQLTISNQTLNNIIEYDSSGIIYFVGNEIISYNKSLLNMFEIMSTDNLIIVHESIHNILNQLKEHLHHDEIENIEIVLNINNEKKSFITSIKQFSIDENKAACRLYKFDSTNKYMRLNINNRAVYTFDDIIGECENMVRLKELAKKTARTSSSILICGESGTGKELFAHSIHNESFRKNKPFVAINCGAIPSELIESELFGYEPGAFTGASNKIKFGKLEIASGGTFFFDEIDSMPLKVQIKLLRALSSNRITRIGGIKEIPIDIRIIAATKKDLLEEIELGQFREDLYFRINIINLTIPPLRDRKDDIPILAESFINYNEKHSNIPDVKVDPEFYEALKYYFWRGNVRELRNVIEKAVLLNDKETLTINNLPREIVSAYKYKSLKSKLSANIIETRDDKNLLKTGEEIIIEFVLNEENWNLTNTAKRLGISRPTLYRKIEESPKLSKRKKMLQ
ncbi:MAG TPA: sigma 54-interacting transcriptional regulator [Sedimentibacter sp.]|nr:sigma 54-interacting transcriptional regulator [Sedimentibacter sp.]